MAYQAPLIDSAMCRWHMFCTSRNEVQVSEAEGDLEKQDSPVIDQSLSQEI